MPLLRKSFLLFSVVVAVSCWQPSEAQVFGLGGDVFVLDEIVVEATPLEDEE